MTWPLVPLGKVARPVARTIRVDPHHLYRLVGVHLWGRGAYDRGTIDGSETVAQTLTLVRQDDLIINKIWVRSGSVAVADASVDGCYGSNEFPAFELDKSQLLPRWMHWYCNTDTFWNQCDAASRGTSGKNRIRPDQLLAIRIPLPPLDEQRRIVARLDAVAQRVAETRRLRAEAQQDVEDLFRAATKGIFAECAYQALPLEAVCSAIIDNLHSNPIYSSEGIACIRSPDVGWGKLDLASAFRTSEEEYCRRTVRGEPSPGDIVLVREGGGTGKAALVENGHRFSLGQRVMMLRPDPSQIEPRFFLHQLLSPVVYDRQMLPQITGSASPHLNINALRRFTLQIPPLAEQRRIVSELDALRARLLELSAEQSRSLTDLELLMPALLDRGFRGEL